MEDLCRQRASACPCCSLIDAAELAHALSMRTSSNSLFRCKLCESELREKASGIQKEALKNSSSSSSSNAKKGANTNSNTKGGNSAKNSTANAIVEAAKIAASLAQTATFVCMSCTYACCADHAQSHFLDTGKKRTKKGGQRHTEHHCVFYNTRASNPSVTDYRAYCVACDIPVGNLPQPYDVEYSNCVDGYAVNNAGYCIDGEDYMTEPCIVLAQAVEEAEDGGNSKMRNKMRKHKFNHDKNAPQTKKELRKAEKKERKAKDRASGGGDSERSRNPEITEQGIIGLQNLGNTCFFNSTLQCLLQLKSLHHAFGFMTEDDLPGPLSIALRRTFGLVEASPIGAVIAPKSLFGQVCARNPMFAEYGQQDAEELFNVITNGAIDEYELKFGKKKPSASKNNNDNDDESQNHIRDSSAEAAPTHCFSGFGAELNIAITCHGCKTVSQLQEDLLDFSLSIHGCHSVLDSLRKFFLPLLMTGSDAYLCEKCCHEEYLIKKRAEEAEKRQREELTKRMMENMKTHQNEGISDEIVASNGQDEGDDDDDDDGDDDDDDDSSTTSSTESSENDEKEPEQNDINNNIGNDTSKSESKSASTESPKQPEQQQQQQQQQQSKSNNQVQEEKLNVAAKTKNANDNDDEQQSEQQQASPSSSSSPPKGAKKYCDATSESTLNSVREVVVLQLKRFSVDWRRQCYVKDNTFISFTADLDLSEFAPKLVIQQQEIETDLALLMSAFPRHSPAVLKSVLEAAGGNADLAMMLIQEGVEGCVPQKDDKKNSSSGKKTGADSENRSNSSAASSSLKYKLVGVVEHMGSVDGGHYVAYTKSSRTGQWYYESDSFVKLCSEGEVLRAQAYMLYYEKC